MSGISVVVSGTLGTIIAPLSKLTNPAAMQPLREGLYEGGDKVRTGVRKALKAQTNVLKYDSITSRVNSRREGLTYGITGEGKGLPIREFPHAAPGHIVASPWGVSHTFKRSFVKPDSGAFVARLSSKRFPIRKLYGPSLAKEIVKDQSLDAFEVGVATHVVPAIEKRLARVFGG